MIDRPQITSKLQSALQRSSAVVLIGPRQCGKTTLARTFVSPESENYFDLEDPVSLIRLEQPRTALGNLSGLVVIDEVQRRPELFPVLRVLIDDNPVPGRFLILGSASPELLKQSSESLAGRVETLEISGFSMADIGHEHIPRHWLRGGFPRSYLAANESDSVAWRKNFVRTFVERDISQFSNVLSANIFRLWTMLAHYHGQILNASELSRSMRVDERTIGRYTELLEHLLMIRKLQPWHVNLKKRQVRSPKVFIRDSGIAHQLLGITSQKSLLEHPKSGATWEGYAIEEILKCVEHDEAYFWAAHSGAELDLLLIRDQQKLGFECKRQDAPSLTKSMHVALEDLELERLFILYPGSKQYTLSDKVTAVPLKSLATNDADNLFFAG